MMLYEYKVLWHCAKNKIYNCIKTMHKITSYKLLNTKFNIGLNAFLVRAQPFQLNGGVGGYSEQLSFSTQHCEGSLTYEKERICTG